MTPTHAPSPCVEQGCFNLATHKGRCAACQLIQGGARRPYDQRRGSSRERGYDRAWEKRRKWHLEAEPFCRTCGKPGNQVDHVIPHRGAEWLFKLKGNLQTLCEQHHQNKTAFERTLLLGIMYPLDLPAAPHYRPTRLLCGPVVNLCLDEVQVVSTDDQKERNVILRLGLKEETRRPLVLIEPAPRTAERAFWSYVMDCPAELQVEIAGAIEGHPAEWWDAYMLDQRAEEAMARRLS